MDNKEKDAITQRPPASAYMLVDSLDRYGLIWPNNTSFTSSTNWILNFQTPILNGFFTRLCLTEVNYAWNTPTILFNYNDQINMLISNSGVGATGLVTLTPGYYTPTALAANLQAAILTTFPAYAGTITCIYDSVFGSFVIASTNVNVTMRINNPATAQNLRHKRTLNTLGLLNTSNSGLQQVIFGSQPTMLATRFVDICSSYLTKYQRVKDGSTLINNPRQDMLTRLYAVAPSTRYNITATDSPGSTPFVITQDMNNPKFFLWSREEALNNFDIQVRDEYGDILQTQQGFMPEYLLTFMATES